MRDRITPPTSLKVVIVLYGIIFWNTELIKPHILRNEIIFMHCSLQIKQNIYRYSKGLFHAPAVAQFMLKV